MEEASAVAGFCHLGVEAHASHGPAKLDGVEAKRDGRHAHHRTKDRPHGVVERGRRSDLHAVCAREIEPFGTPGEIVVELLPPMAAGH